MRIATHRQEAHAGSVAGRLNWLRAGVLGANDGIISTAGLVMGVAAATTHAAEIATAGFAGLIAGAVSMALGEYVSVSTQRDTERALIDKERGELGALPVEEHAELVGLLEARGLSPEVSKKAADELTRRNALGAHLSFELGMSEDDLANPWTAAGASAVAFAAGAIVPLVAILVPPASARIVVTFFAVVAGLLVTGWLSSHLGRAPKRAAILRLVVGGAVAMAVTFGVGYVFGAATG